MDVTGYFTLCKKELQGKDNLTAEIADNDKVFKVHLPLSIKLNVRMCSFTCTQENPFNLDHSNF